MLRNRLYIFPCSSIHSSEIVVVSNVGLSDEFFVVHSRGEWLTNFNEIISVMSSVNVTGIVADKSQSDLKELLGLAV